MCNVFEDICLSDGNVMAAWDQLILLEEQACQMPEIEPYTQSALIDNYLKKLSDGHRSLILKWIDLNSIYYARTEAVVAEALDALDILLMAYEDGDSRTDDTLFKRFMDVPDYSDDAKFVYEYSILDMKHRFVFAPRWAGDCFIYVDTWSGDINFGMKSSLDKYSYNREFYEDNEGIPF